MTCCQLDTDTTDHLNVSRWPGTPDFRVTSSREWSKVGDKYVTSLRARQMRKLRGSRCNGNWALVSRCASGCLGALVAV